ncbi:MAG: MBL fold metallo-hydrolase, partial [Spirochaetota bacterium]|nr:MBL fold metallo-hydrolase [Spirochaetota bacterium]
MIKRGFSMFIHYLLLSACFFWLASCVSDGGKTPPLKKLFTSDFMTLESFGDNIYMVRGVHSMPSKENRGFMSNAYGILTSEGWVLIDSLATGELSKRFVNLLFKVKKAPIIYVIITHYHMDHWFGASTLKGPNTKIIGHKTLKERFDQGLATENLKRLNTMFKGIFDTVRLLPPDILVSDSLTITAGGEDFIIQSMTPAHTNTDITVYMSSRKLMFVGDLVNYKRVPNAHADTSSSKNWLKCLEDMKKSESKYFLSGHNKPLTKKALDFMTGYLLFLRQNIAKYQEEGLSYDQIKDKLNSKAYSDLKMSG